MSLPIPRFIPERFGGVSLTCGKCATLFEPGWLVPRKFPTTSVPANAGQGHWIPQLFDDCPKCGEKVEVPLPVRKLIARLLLFGDEAMRPLGKRGGQLYCFATIGGSSATLQRLDAGVSALKRRLVPDLPPSEWKLHMKMIWSGDARRKTKAFAKWDKHTTDMLWRGLRDICGSLNGELWRHSIVISAQPLAPIATGAFEAYLRDTAYTHLVLFLIDEATDKGAQPIMHFDAQKKMILETAVHGWARRAFTTSEQTLAHAFVCRGIPVPEPVFVQPASHAALELADILSFATARLNFRAEQGNPPDIDLSIFGTVKYLTIDTKTGDLLFRSSVGWPWRVGWQS